MTVDLDDLRHPIWQAMEARWRMALDFWIGGKNVLQPSWPAYEGKRPSADIPNVVAGDTGGTDSEQPLQRQTYSWTTTKENSYLWPHDKESDNEFHNRQKRQWHYPVYQKVVNIFASGTLKNLPLRDDLVGMWADYHDNVDFCKTNFPSFSRHSLSLALVFGRIHALTDRPAGDDSISRAEQLERGIRAYSSIVTPIDLVDWQLDRFGNFDWVRIREDAEIDRSPLEVADDIELPSPNQYRIWTPTAWYLMVASKGDDGKKTWSVFDSGDNPCGRVPLSTLSCTRDGRPASMACESPFADILDGDRSLLNDVSGLDELKRTQAFAMLWLPESEQGQLGPIDVGPTKAMAGAGDAGTPSYIEPDPNTAKGIAEQIKTKIQDLLTMSGATRGKAEFSKEERATSALEVEKEDVRNQMASWIAAVQEYDEDIHKNVASWEEIKGALPTGKYPRDFDIRSISVSIQDLVQLGGTGTLSPTAKAEIAKPIVQRILKGYGMKDDEVAVILKTLDEHAKEVDAMEIEVPTDEKRVDTDGKEKN